MAKIRLLPGAVLDRDNNHHGLDLPDWQALEGGKVIEVEVVGADLLPLVEVIDEEVARGNRK
jgi:hypothetical protein